MAKDKKQPKGIKHFIPALLVILAVILLVTVPILVNLKTGPVDRIQKAALNTLLCDNFTMEFNMDIDGTKSEGTLTAAIDPAQEKLDLFIELSAFTAEYECGIYDNTFVIVNGSNGDTQTVDVTDRVHSFFALLTQDTVPDWSLLLDFEDVDLHEQITKDFDFSAFMTCLGQWLNNMNKANWAKQNAGYAKDTEKGVTTFTFQPDLHTLATQTAPVFEEAFKDPQRYQDLLKYLDDGKYLFKDGIANLSFQVQNSYLTAADFTLHYNQTNMRINLLFGNFGTTKIETGALSHYIDQANQ